MWPCPENCARLGRAGISVPLKVIAVDGQVIFIKILSTRIQRAVFFRKNEPCAVAIREVGRAAACYVLDFVYIIATEWLEHNSCT